MLMISGRTEKSDIVQAIHTGIDGYLSKPFGPAQLRDKRTVASVVSFTRTRPSRSLASIAVWICSRKPPVPARLVAENGVLSDDGGRVDR